MKYLVRWEDNWADEMDLEGWKVMDQAELDAWKSRLEKIGYCTLSFGTNEENEYESGREILNCCTIKTITDTDAEVLQRLFRGADGFIGFVHPYSEDDEDED